MADVHAGRAPVSRGLLPTVCFVVTLTSVLTTAVVPLLPRMGEQLGLGPAPVSWVLTANLLAAAVGTPVLGRLADRRDPRAVLLAILGTVVAGTALCALWESYVPLIIGRTMQGLSFASFPICVALLRSVLDPRRLTGAIGVMSGLLALGGGAGVVLAGLLQSGDPDYRVVFWALFAASILASALTLVFVPSVSRPWTPLGLDPRGQLVLTASLVSLLLWLSLGEQLGWGSPGSIALALVGVLAFTAFVRLSGRSRDPLVPPSLLVTRPVVYVHTAALLVGVTMYIQFLGVTLFVQTDPAVAGYGFGASVLRTSLVYLLPGLVAGGVASISSGYLVTRFGAGRFFLAACSIGVAGFVWLTLLRGDTWHIIVGVILLNVYVNSAYAALPSLIVADVGEGDTGLANGINAVARTFGSSLGSAFLGSLFATMSLTGTAVPRAVAYDIGFSVAAGGVVLAALAVALSTGRAAARTRATRDVETTTRGRTG